MSDKKPSIDVKKKLRDFKDNVIVMSEPTGAKDDSGKPIMEDKEMRLGDVLTFALMSAPKDDSPKLKLARFVAAIKINTVLENIDIPGTIDFTNAEIKTCIDAAGEHLTTIFYGRVLEILDPNQFK